MRNVRLLQSASFFEEMRERMDLGAKWRESWLVWGTGGYREKKSKSVPGIMRQGKLFLELEGTERKREDWYPEL